MHGNRWMVLVLIIGALQLWGCTRTTAADTASHEEPARVEPVEGSKVSRLTLTARAAERLGIQTTPVREGRVAGSRTLRKVIPYSAVIYDAHGETWTYTSPQALVFVRHPLTVERIEGEHAFLAEGPPAGTAVVTVGAAELFGTEFEVGH